MGFFDRLFGASEREPERDPDAWRANHQARPGGQGAWQPGAPTAGPAGAGRAPLSEDERAVERYRYLLQTAPPDQIERVHAEAFAKLSPEQRRLVFDRLAESTPPGEAPRSDGPDALARAATRQEMREPGFMERALGDRSASGRGGGLFGGGGGGGLGFGGILGASILGVVVGNVVSSAIVAPLFAGFGDDLSAAADGVGDGFGDATTDAAGSVGDAAADSGLGGLFGGDWGGFDGGGDGFEF